MQPGFVKTSSALKYQKSRNWTKERGGRGGEEREGGGGATFLCSSSVPQLLPLLLLCSFVPPLLPVADMWLLQAAPPPVRCLAPVFLLETQEANQAAASVRSLSVVRVPRQSRQETMKRRRKTAWWTDSLRFWKGWKTKNSKKQTKSTKEVPSCCFLLCYHSSLEIKKMLKKWPHYSLSASEKTAEEEVYGRKSSDKQTTQWESLWLVQTAISSQSIELPIFIMASFVWMSYKYNVDPSSAVVTVTNRQRWQKDSHSVKSTDLTPWLKSD